MLTRTLKFARILIKIEMYTCKTICNTTFHFNIIQQFTITRKIIDTSPTDGQPAVI